MAHRTSGDRSGAWFLRRRPLRRRLTSAPWYWRHDPDGIFILPGHQIFGWWSQGLSLHNLPRSRRGLSDQNRPQPNRRFDRAHPAQSRASNSWPWKTPRNAIATQAERGWFVPALLSCKFWGGCPVRDRIVSLAVPHQQPGLQSGELSCRDAPEPLLNSRFKVFFTGECCVCPTHDVFGWPTKSSSWEPRLDSLREL